MTKKEDRRPATGPPGRAPKARHPRQQPKTSGKAPSAASAELDALNGELKAVNSQLEAKVRELEAANDDLNNLLASTEIATLFLDKALRVRRFTPASAPILNLKQNDLGRPLADLAPRIRDPQLLGEAARILESGGAVEAEFRTEDGGAFIRKVLPYRTGHGEIEGVCITFSEITGLRRVTDQLGQRARQQEAVVQLGRTALAGEPLDQLFELAVNCLTRQLDCRFAKVLECLPDCHDLLLRSGLGWREGLVGTAILPAGPGSQHRFTLSSGTPVVFTDLARERRFGTSALCLEHGIASGITVPIGLEEAPWGVLGVYDDRPRPFHSDDVAFVQAVANLLFGAIERESRMAELERAAQRLRLALDGARMGSWEWDLAKGLVTLDRRACRLLGLPVTEEPLPVARFTGLVPREELRAARRTLARARRRGELYWPELRVIGETWAGDRWLGVRGRTLGGNRMIGLVEDVTALKEEFVRREMLLAELDHRVKNILANVNAIARQTGRRHSDAAEFIATLEGRIQAMAYAHSLLSASRWTGASLRSLVEAELAPFTSNGGSSVTIEGPDLLLAPKPAQSFSLALHELATNAVKHGALGAGGRVAIGWEVLPAGEHRVVRLEWRETGGPAERPEVQDGFGMTVLKRMAPKDLGAEVDLIFGSDGLCYRIQFPLERMGAPEHGLDEAAWPGLAGGAAEAGAGVATGRDPAESDSHGPAAGNGPGAPLKVLVVEDVWAVGEQLRTLLEMLGHEPVGPVSTLAEGLALAELEGLDAAILDIRLDQDLVFPIARRLAERDVPFGFASGRQDETAIPVAFKNRPSISKPFVAGNIRFLLEQLLPK